MIAPVAQITAHVIVTMAVVSYQAGSVRAALDSADQAAGRWLIVHLVGLSALNVPHRGTTRISPSASSVRSVLATVALATW